MTRFTLLLCLLVSSCATRVVYMNTPLPLPQKPLLPTINASSLQCLSDETYKNLVRRDVLRRQYSETLFTIIKTNNSEKR